MVRKLILLSLGLAAATAVWAADTAKPLTVADTPAAVQQTITAHVGEGKVTDIDQTNENNEVEFDVTMTATNGDKRDFSVADDGTLLSVELSMAETPDAVEKTIQSQTGGWQLTSIDKNVADAEVTYDVVASRGGHDKNFTVAENGDLVSEEVVMAAVPEGATKTIEAQTVGGKVDSVDEMFDEHGSTFEVAATLANGDKKGFTVTPDGRVASEAVSLKEVPDPVRKTIEEKLGGGKVLHIDRSLIEKKDDVLPFKVEGRKNGKAFDFLVGPKGRFLGMDE